MKKGERLVRSPPYFEVNFFRWKAESLRRMVGTGRFELPTPRTPSVLAAFAAVYHGIRELAVLATLRGISWRQIGARIAAIYPHFLPRVPTKVSTVFRLNFIAQNRTCAPPPA